MVLLVVLVLLSLVAIDASGYNEPQAETAGKPVPDANLQACMAILSEQQRETLLEFPRVDFLLPDFNGTPAYVFGDLGQVQDSTAASALEFLEQARPLLKSEGNDAYEHISTEVDQIGQAHYRFQQCLNGLPVKGAVLIVHVECDTGRVVGMNGHIATGEAAEVPGVNASMALTVAIENVHDSSENLGKIALNIEAQPLTEPTLTYILTSEGCARLAWRATYNIATETGTEAITLYADANSGELVLRESQINNILNRQIYDFDGQLWKEKPITLGKLVYKENGSLANADQETKDVHPKLATIYNYLKKRFNRKSFDNKDSIMKASVHAYNYAFWSSEHQAAFFADANSDHYSTTRSLDTVAHEFGHGVNWSSANMGQGGESEMLSEGFADIMGACVDAYKENYSGGANFDDPVHYKVWSSGEDWWNKNDPSKPLRSLRNPKSCNDTNNTYVDYYPNIHIEPTNPDKTNTYEGSAVAALAFYLLAEGGGHPNNAINGQVYGLGIRKAEQIFYRALTAYLTPFANYSDARQCTYQAACDLYGSNSFEKTQVRSCWETVGVPFIFPPSAREISNGQRVDPSLDRPGWQYFVINIPAKQGKLEVAAWGGSGDADIFVKRGIAPTLTSYDQASEGPGVAKTIRVNNPLEGLWYIAVHVQVPIGFSFLEARYSSTSGHVQVYERETNNLASRANLISSANTTVLGRLYKYIDAQGNPTFTDDDFYKISIPARRTVFITMTCPPGYDYKIAIEDANGNILIDPPANLGGYCGKYKTIDINNYGDTSQIIYAHVYAGDWKSEGGHVISSHCDPTKYYYLNVTW